MWCKWSSGLLYKCDWLVVALAISWRSLCWRELHGCKCTSAHVHVLFAKGEPIRSLCTPRCSSGLKSSQVKPALAIECQSVCPVISLSNLSEIVDMIRSHMNCAADLASPTITARSDLNLTPEIIHEKGLTVLEGCQLEY